MAAWEKQLQRTNFKVNKSTKVYSNHFAGGYRRDTCEKPILYMKGYPDEGNNVKTRERVGLKRNSELTFPLSFKDDFTLTTLNLFSVVHCIPLALDRFKEGNSFSSVLIFVSKTVCDDIRFSVISVEDGFISVFMVVTFSE